MVEPWLMSIPHALRVRPIKKQMKADHLSADAQLLVALEAEPPAASEVPIKVALRPAVAISLVNFMV